MAGGRIFPFRCPFGIPFQSKNIWKWEPSGSKSLIFKYLYFRVFKIIKSEKIIIKVRHFRVILPEVRQNLTFFPLSNIFPLSNPLSKKKYLTFSLFLEKTFVYAICKSGIQKKLYIPSFFFIHFFQINLRDFLCKKVRKWDILYISL